MKLRSVRQLYPGFLAGAFIVIACAPPACTPAAKSTATTIANDALPIAQLICLETSGATTLDGLKQVCAGIDALTPAELDTVIQLLDQKRVAEKAGFSWRQDGKAKAKASDAGVK